MVFADRYDKKTPFLTSNDPRFGIVRAPLYRHNSEAQSKFFNEAVYSFIFVVFGKFEMGSDFLRGSNAKKPK